jgi:hypothetical protein
MNAETKLALCLAAVGLLGVGMIAVGLGAPKLWVGLVGLVLVVAALDLARTFYGGRN